MALRLRTRSEVQSNYRLIHPKDPAVDRTEMAALRTYEGDEFRPGTWDVDDLVLREGFTPTVFVCRPLSARAVLSCDAHESDELGQFWAFRYGVESIEGAEGEDEPIDMSSTSTEAGT